MFLGRMLDALAGKAWGKKAARSVASAVSAGEISVKGGEKALPKLFSKTEEALPRWVRPQDTFLEATIADFARHFRLAESPALVAHLEKLDTLLGRDAIRRIAANHPGQRAGFLAELVATAERRGYPDLRGLQDALPKSFLHQAACPFCNSHDLLKPLNSIVAESKNFVAAPNRRQLFALEGEEGGHVMVFAKHHRSTPSALPTADRQELVSMIRKVKTEMEAVWKKPVSLFANGMPGANTGINPRILEGVDSHAHVQLFTGDTTIEKAVLAELGAGRERLIPVNGFEDYFKLYDAGKLRGRYVLSLDAQEKGYVILVGDQITASGLAARAVRSSLGLSEQDLVRGDTRRASLVAAVLQAHAKNPADDAAVRSIFASAPVAVKKQSPWSLF